MANQFIIQNILLGVAVVTVIAFLLLVILPGFLKKPDQDLADLEKDLQDERAEMLVATRRSRVLRRTLRVARRRIQRSQQAEEDEAVLGAMDRGDKPLHTAIPPMPESGL